MIRDSTNNTNNNSNNNNNNNITNINNHDNNNNPLNYEKSNNGTDSTKFDFTDRQFMMAPDLEFFHYINKHNMEIDYHNHDFYEIYFLISGNVTYLIEGRSYRLRPGDIILISDKELHRPVIGQGAPQGAPYERVVLWVKPDYLKRQSTENTNLSACFEAAAGNAHNLMRPEPETLSKIKATLNRFEKAYYNKGYGNDILRTTYLTELLVYINLSFSQNSSATLSVDEDIVYNEKIDQVITYINNHISEDLSLERLSDEFYTSKYHLLREFKKYTGFTLHKYIRQKRLITARTLLREGGQVTEIAMQSGFGDYSNFIRSFRDTYHISPGKYMREKNRI